MSFRTNQTYNLLNVTNVLDSYSVRKGYYFPVLAVEAVLFLLVTIISFHSLLKAVKNIPDHTLQTQLAQPTKKLEGGFYYTQDELRYSAEQTEQNAEGGQEDPHFSILQTLQLTENKIIQHFPYHTPALLMIVNFGMQTGFIVLYLIYVVLDFVMIIRGWDKMYRGLEIVTLLLVVGMYVYYLVAEQVFITGSFF